MTDFFEGLRQDAKSLFDENGVARNKSDVAEAVAKIVGHLVTKSTATPADLTANHVLDLMEAKRVADLNEGFDEDYLDD